MTIVHTHFIPLECVLPQAHSELSGDIVVEDVEGTVKDDSGAYQVCMI